MTATVAKKPRAKKPAGGKWAHLRGQYPTLPLDPKFDDVVAAIRDEFAGRDLAAILAEWNVADEAKADLEAQVSDLNARIVALEREAFARMDASDQELAVVGSGRFSRGTDVTATQADPPTIRKWFFAHMPDMLSVHASRLNSLVKSAIEGDGDIPEGVEINLRDRIERKNA